MCRFHEHHHLDDSNGHIELASIQNASTADTRTRERSKMVETGRKWGAVMTGLPVAIVIIDIVSTMTSYVIGVRVGTIEPWPYLPFISEVGKHVPNSSIFTLGLTLSSILMVIFIVVRFLHTRKVFEGRHRKISIVSLIAGLVHALGGIVTVAFELTSIRAAHFVGAFLYFFGGLLYAVFETYISTRERHHTIVARPIIALRWIAICGMLASIIVFGMFKLPGYQLTAKIGEWVMGLFWMILMLTFCDEFRKSAPRFTVDFIPLKSSDLLRGAGVATVRTIAKTPETAHDNRGSKRYGSIDDSDCEEV